MMGDKYKALSTLSILVVGLTVFASGDATAQKERGLFIKKASNPSFLAITSPLYGPFKGGETVEFKWSYYNDTYVELPEVIDYFIVSCPSYSSIPIHSKKVGMHELRSWVRYECTYSYKIPSKYLNMNSGITIKVGVYYTRTESYLNTVEKIVRPINSSKINPLNYRLNPYIISGRTFYLDSSSPIKEQFLFDEYSDYVECDSHNRLLFDKLSFEYGYISAFTYESVLLRFIDKHDLYPYLDKDGDGYSYIPMSFIEEEGRVKLTFNNLYVDPITLTVNHSKIGNKTDHLYCPKSKAYLLKDYLFEISAYGLGLNKTSFSYELECDVSSFYLGSCLDADYCVIGGVKA